MSVDVLVIVVVDVVVVHAVSREPFFFFQLEVTFPMDHPGFGERRKIVTRQRALTSTRKV